MNQKIAIVDDDSKMCSIYKIMLNSLGHKDITIYNNPEKFLTSDLNYTHIFLDLNMPLKSGIQVIQEIKDLEKFRLCLVSGDDYDYIYDQLEPLIESEKIEVFIKPVNLTDLKDFLST